MVGSTAACSLGRDAIDVELADGLIGRLLRADCVATAHLLEGFALMALLLLCGGGNDLRCGGLVHGIERPIVCFVTAHICTLPIARGDDVFLLSVSGVCRVFKSCRRCLVVAAGVRLVSDRRCREAPLATARLDARLASGTRHDQVVGDAVVVMRRFDRLLVACEVRHRAAVRPDVFVSAICEALLAARLEPGHLIYVPGSSRRLLV